MQNLENFPSTIITLTLALWFWSAILLILIYHQIAEIFKSNYNTEYLADDESTIKYEKPKKPIKNKKTKFHMRLRDRKKIKKPIRFGDYTLYAIKKD